jgi:hypothetical protein
LIARLAEFFGTNLAIKLIEQRLGIECFNVTGAAGHEKEDDGFGFGGQVRFFGSERIEDGALGALLVQHGCERERTEAAEGVAHEFASAARDLKMAWVN